MTARTKSVLKSSFETGDTPDGSDYTDLMDSFLNLADTSAQTVTSPVTFSGALTLSTVPIFVQVTTLASAGGVEKWLKISVSGVDYGAPLYRNG